MSDWPALPFSDMPPGVRPQDIPGNRRVLLPKSRKQRIIFTALRDKPALTLDDAVALIGGDIYANARFHVGNLLGNMVKRGMLRRVKPGVFALA